LPCRMFSRAEWAKPDQTRWLLTVIDCAAVESLYYVRETATIEGSG
jgi:hypothetical protein